MCVKISVSNLPKINVLKRVTSVASSFEHDCHRLSEKKNGDKQESNKYINESTAKRINEEYDLWKMLPEICHVMKFWFSCSSFGLCVVAPYRCRPKWNRMLIIIYFPSISQGVEWSIVITKIDVKNISTSKVLSRQKYDKAFSVLCLMGSKSVNWPTEIGLSTGLYHKMQLASTKRCHD